MAQEIYKAVDLARITDIEEKENLLTITFDNGVTLALSNENGKIVTKKV